MSLLKRLFDLDSDDIHLTKKQKAYHYTKPGTSSNPKHRRKRRKKTLNPTHPVVAYYPTHLGRNNPTMPIQGSVIPMQHEADQQHPTDDSTPTALAYRNLNIKLLHYPRLGTSHNFENRRAHNVFFKGVRIVKQIDHQRGVATTTGCVPVIWHYMIIQAKCRLHTEAEMKTELERDFFTDHRGTSGVTAEFIPSTNDPDYITRKTSLPFYNYQPTTRQGNWRLLYRTRRTIYPSQFNTPHTGYHKLSSRKFKKYFKINRKVHFDASTGQPEWPIFEVMWCEALNPKDVTNSTFPAAAAANPTTLVDVYELQTSYFKDK